MAEDFDFSGFHVTAEQLRQRHAARPYDSSTPVHFIHVVNPVNVPVSHDLARAQQVTYRSMRHAVAYAATVDPSIAIDLVSAALPEDAPATPEGFIQLPHLERDSTHLRDFRVPRRLPLTLDVIARAREFADADSRAGTSPTIVFTNVDIAVLPHFYTYAAWLVRHEHDVAIINRRGIVDFNDGAEDMPAMMSDYGLIHPGLDCFIFDAAIVDRFVPFNSIIGMDLAMRALYFNLVAAAKNPVLLTNAHATFHIGMDEDWKQDRYKDYADFNRIEWLKVISDLCRDPAVERKLRQFVRVTGEHRLLPNGILGVHRPIWEDPMRKAAHRAKRWVKRKLIAVRA